MEADKSHYGQVVAKYYDIIFKSFCDDLVFYVEESQKSHGPVLELGCGTGRVAIPIAKAGIEITGIDISDEMLSVANEKCAKLSDDVVRLLSFKKDDMESFSLNQKFPLILIPFRAFLHILTPEAQRRSLINIRKHLSKKGKLIISIFDPNLKIISDHSGSARDTVKKIKEIEIENGKLVAWETRSYDTLNQIVHCGRIYEEFDDLNVSRSRLHTSFDLRFNYRYEMQYLFELCGYKVADLYGDFDRGAYRHGGEQIWILEDIG
ncbi:MAG: class I SAM-dependent methyltransferase [Spirochaetales bacterium]|jgi:SAM-dependent methyltransferase|nr:class I SAM-dependent methyltransferase [Spirochaetales bacterium]